MPAASNVMSAILFRMPLQLTRWIRLAPVVFALHDLEEILTVERWLRQHTAQLPDLLLPFSGITTRQFTAGVLFLFAVILAATVHGVRCTRRGKMSWIFMVTAGALTANGITHVAQAAYFREYTPGVVTADHVDLFFRNGAAAQSLGRQGLELRRHIGEASPGGVPGEAEKDPGLTIGGGDMAAAVDPENPGAHPGEHRLDELAAVLRLDAGGA